MSQFKKLFPASATPYKLSAGKVSIKLKLQNKWDSDTLDDLTELVNLFGFAGDNLHLSKVQEGCIAVTWLCFTADVKDLKVAIFEAADSLQTRGVLQVFVGEELMWELYSQPKPGNEYCYVQTVDVDNPRGLHCSKHAWLCTCADNPWIGCSIHRSHKTKGTEHRFGQSSDTDVCHMVLRLFERA